MRYRIKDYTISGQTITIQGEFDIEDIRLIVDETQKEILCSSTDKDLDGVVYDSGLDATIITIPLSICRLVNTDKLTIEVDCGDSPADLAQQGSNVEATNSAILDVLGGIATTMYKGVPIIHLYPATSYEPYTMQPNQYTIIHEAEVPTNIVLHKGTETEGIVNHYMVRVENNIDHINSITFNGFSLKWLGGVAPDLGAKGTFEISIINDLALYTKV